MFDERFFRMWEFYLASCESAFKWGDQVVYQFQLTKNYISTPTTKEIYLLLINIYFLKLIPLSSRIFLSSPFSYISLTMSQPPINSPLM